MKNVLNVGDAAAAAAAGEVIATAKSTHFIVCDWEFTRKLHIFRVLFSTTYW